MIEDAKLRQLFSATPGEKALSTVSTEAPRSLTLQTTNPLALQNHRMNYGFFLRDFETVQRPLTEFKDTISGLGVGGSQTADAETFIRRVNSGQVRNDLVMRDDLDVAVQHMWRPLSNQRIMPTDLKLFDFTTGEVTSYANMHNGSFLHTKIFGNGKLTGDIVDGEQAKDDIAKIVDEHFTHSATGIPLKPLFDRLS